MVYYKDDQMKYTQYMKRVVYIIQKAIEKNNNGVYFPLFGICLGFEEFLITAVNEYILEVFDARKYRTNMMFTEEAVTSKMLKDADPRLLYYMSTANITFENHGKGVSPQMFLSKCYVEYPILQEMYTPLAFSKDRNGAVNIALIEAKRYPFYGFMFHSEKPA